LKENEKDMDDYDEKVDEARETEDVDEESVVFEKVCSVGMKEEELQSLVEAEIPVLDLCLSKDADSRDD
jgi:hypothetical protein